MNVQPLNVLDGLIIITLGWNFLRGFRKGFVEELLSIGGLIVSVIVAFKFSPSIARQLFPSAGSSEIIGVGVATFFSLFLIFKYLAFSLDRKLSRTSLGIINNFLGFLFGVFRGYALSAVIVLGIALLSPESYLIKKSYLGGITVPLIDRAMLLIPEETRDSIEGKWQIAKVYLLENFEKWKEKGGVQNATPPSPP